MRTKKGSRAQPQRVAPIYIAGRGIRADGAGSGYAWTDEEEKSSVNIGRRLSKDASEYAALKDALLSLPKNRKVEIFSDSELVINQFNGRWAVRDLKLFWRLNRIRQIIVEHRLTVTLSWLRPGANLARRMLQTYLGDEEGIIGATSSEEPEC